MNILEILENRGVEYVDHGNNVKKGFVAVHCPWCGDNDRSHHMNIHPVDGNWFCFRNREQHKGRRPHRLLMRLLGCSYDTIQSLLKGRSDLQSLRERLNDDKTPPPAKASVNNQVERNMPKISAIETHQRFYRYLETRGYDAIHIHMLAATYDLRCALSGRFKNRIVFPVKVRGRVIGHTGRCVDNGRLRYLSYPGSAIKQHLLWYDLMRKEHTLPQRSRKGAVSTRSLYICEGPFDAMRIDYVARASGLNDRATCLFTTSATPGQIDEIHKLKKKFTAIYILFDKGALTQAMRLRAQLVGCKTTITQLPEGIEDPGDMSWSGTLQFLNRC